jgi:YVTN family beta-propeller protein
MKCYKQSRHIVFITSVLFLLSGFGFVSADIEHENENEAKYSKAEQLKTYSKRSGKVVIANRASGSISIIDGGTDKVIKTIILPAGSKQAEPMYVVHTPESDRVFVGDRANNRVIVLDDKSFNVEGYVPAGNGVFHMWADPSDAQLWVNNDIDKTSTVIDPETLEVLATVAIPKDIVALGGKPHDVILDPSGDFAYVTIVGSSTAYDFVVKFSTSNFKEVQRAEVGKDPHLSLTRKNKLLYVPTQNNNAVYILARKDLSLVKLLSVPGAHGAAIPRNGATFYTTNISGGGVDGLYSISTKTNEILGEAVDTAFPVPHNIVLNRRGSKLYVTHSGATANQVTVYNINDETYLPEFTSTITVGNNPFGLTFVK